MCVGPLKRMTEAAASLLTTSSTLALGSSRAHLRIGRSACAKVYYHESRMSKAAPVEAEPETRIIPDDAFPKSAVTKPPQPQLNIWEHAHKPTFYNAISEIMRIRDRYLEDRCAFIDGRSIIPILKGLGARDADFEALKLVSNNLYTDPTLPFRRSRNGRFCLDFGTASVRRLQFQPFALSLDEDFKRYDSGQVRVFDELQDELQLNAAFQALLVFKALVCRGVQTIPRHNLDYDSDKWVCTLFNLRTVTTPSMLGEPALEGVHTDGVDHTMTTYLGSRNMARHSAVTFMHEMHETTGAKFTDIKPELVRGREQHRRFLDTLLIVDHERKHCISPVYAVDPEKEATRDMLIFFTRRPVMKQQGHISSDIDSLKPHKEMPMEVPMFMPQVS